MTVSMDKITKHKLTVTALAGISGATSNGQQSRLWSTSVRYSDPHRRLRRIRQSPPPRARAPTRHNITPQSD